VALYRWTSLVDWWGSIQYSPHIGEPLLPKFQTLPGGLLNQIFQFLIFFNTPGHIHVLLEGSKAVLNLVKKYCFGNGKEQSIIEPEGSQPYKAVVRLTFPWAPTSSR
jgi:hypothetical protein